MTNLVNDRFADGYAAGRKDFQMVGSKRIEKLEAALRKIMSLDDILMCRYAQEIASAALAEEQDK